MTSEQKGENLGENSGGEIAASDVVADPRVAAALARNDRYLHEFVEALQLCPWAKRCREIGRLSRHVILEPAAPISNAKLSAAGVNVIGNVDVVVDVDVDGIGNVNERSKATNSPEFTRAVHSAMVHIRALGQKPATEVEVGLLIFPALAPQFLDGLSGARAFEQLCAAVRDAMASEYASSQIPFYCVAFHPELGIDLADENRAVRFIRRSPDPTLQLVRVSVLLEARGSEGDTRYLDASRMTPAELMAVRRPLSISEKIAQTNWETLKREGPERLRTLLGEMARRQS